MDNNLDLGASAKLHCTVSPYMTAASFAQNPGELFPNVLATPFLVGDLERACAKLLEPLIGPGQLSVGAHINIKHMAPTGVGGKYTCTATYTEQSGPLYWFEVSAEDNVGLIGKGRIARAIVNEADILARGAKSVPNLK